MADIVNQYNNDHSFNPIDDITIPSIDPKVEESCFIVKKVNYTPPHHITYMVTSNHILVMALENGTIRRLNFKDPEEIQQIEISRKDQIYKLFLDPTGNHLLITMTNEDNYYLNTKWKKPKPLGNKMRGIIEACAWDRGGPYSIANLLVGTRAGQILELVIDSKETSLLSLAGGKERVKQLFMLSGHPIIGLACEKFPASETDKYFIMVATQTGRIYQFIGGPTYEALFQHYENTPSLLRLSELPSDFPGELQFFSVQGGGLANTFAWLTVAGVWHGDIVFGSQNPGDTIGTQQDLAPYPDNSGPAKSLVLTEFHYLLLYPNKFVATSRITNSKNMTVVTYEYKFFPDKNPSKPMLKFAHDPILGIIFAYSGTGIWEIIVKDEDRNVWEKYLQNREFDLALKYAKTPSQQDKVWIKRSEYHFAKADYGLAARYYAKTSRSFEEIALKFIEKEQDDALRVFLQEKLQKINKREHTQFTLICTWLVELYLDKLNALDSSEDDKAKDQKQVVIDSFFEFLDDYKDRLYQSTTSLLMSSHGRTVELLYYSQLISDYDKLISYNLHRGQWRDTLDILKMQKDPNLYYKYSPVLLVNLPYETINVLMRITELIPRKLIPALMRYEAANEHLLRNPYNPNLEPSEEHQGIRYLNHVVTQCGNKDAAVHNYLLSLYTKYQDYPLESFLLQAETSYDLQFALRLCTERNKVRACVIILSKMNLYEEAVDRALTVDIDLAKSIADQPAKDPQLKNSDKDELRKKLWLRIARHVVEEDKKIKKAMEFLQDCDLLKIEDILPFFPDFVLIDDFKDAIINALHEYNKHLEDLQKQMKETTKSAELIREDIKMLRNNYVMIEGSQKCILCKYPILTSPIYLFPCGHVFHCTCLQTEMKNYLSAQDKLALEQFLSRLSILEGGHVPENTGNSFLSAFSNNSDDSFFGAGNIISNIANMRDADTPGTSVQSLDVHRSVQLDKQQLKDNIDNLVAFECFLCGDTTINAINKTFVKEYDI